MRKDIFLFVIGMAIFLTPFLGIPESWKSILLFILGSGVVFGALACRVGMREREQYENEMFHEEREPRQGVIPVANEHMTGFGE